MISLVPDQSMFDYLGIEPERIWDIVERDLPPLKMQISAICDDLGE